MSESERSGEECAGAINHTRDDHQFGEDYCKPDDEHLEYYEGTIENGQLSIQPDDVDDDYIEMSRWISADPGSYVSRKDMDGGLAPYFDPDKLLVAIQVTYNNEPHYQIQEQGNSPGIIVHQDDLDNLGDWR